MPNRRGSVCPECGGTLTGSISGGIDSEGNRIRLRLCRTCEIQFTTVEVAIPFSFKKIDVTKRDRRRIAGETTYPPRVVPDYLEIEPLNRSDATTTMVVRIKQVEQPPRRCMRGLHELTGDNVYTQPKSGNRSCMACRRVSANARYKHAMERMPPAIRAELNERNRTNLALRRAKHKEERTTP